MHICIPNFRNNSHRAWLRVLFYYIPALFLWILLVLKIILITEILENTSVHTVDNKNHLRAYFPEITLVINISVSFFPIRLVSITGQGSLIQNAGDQKCFGFRIFFWILEYSHICSKIIWGPDPSLNRKFTYVSYTPQTHILKVLLSFPGEGWINCVLCTCVLTATGHMRSGVEVSTSVRLVLKKFQIWEHFGLGMLKLY